jgi:N-acetylneuraminic acid mutarotase
MSRNKLIVLVLGLGGAVFLFFILAVIVIVWLVFSFMSGYNQIVTDHFQKIEDGQIEEAYREDTAEIFKETTTLNEYENFTEQYEVFENFESFSSSSVVQENDIVTIEGTIKAEDGQTVPVIINLVKENDEWKIANMQLG